MINQKQKYICQEVCSVFSLVQYFPMERDEIANVKIVIKDYLESVGIREASRVSDAIAEILDVIINEKTESSNAATTTGGNQTGG